MYTLFLDWNEKFNVFAPLENYCFWFITECSYTKESPTPFSCTSSLLLLLFSEWSLESYSIFLNISETVSLIFLIYWTDEILPVIASSEREILDSTLRVSWKIELVSLLGIIICWCIPSLFGVFYYIGSSYTWFLRLHVSLSSSSWFGIDSSSLW